MSLVNDSLKFTLSDTQICWNFCWKNVSSFCTATHIFSAKNIRILYSESAKTVNKMTLNELVKLTTLWTTGPSSIISSVSGHFGPFTLSSSLPILLSQKNSCVSANLTDPVSNTWLCYFLSVKTQNKKVKHWPTTKYLYFHKIKSLTPVLFRRKNRKIKKKFLLRTDQIFFSAC